jgi:hypothetical protein
MLSSENVLQVLGYVLAFELVGTSDPWPRRFRALAPLTVLSAGYVVVHRALGFGAAGRGYVDPLADPGAFLQVVPARLADLVHEGVLAVRAFRPWTASPWQLEVLPLPPAGRIVLAAVLVAGLALALEAAARRTAGGPALRWLGLGGLLALLPALPGQPGPRLLLVPSIGIAVAIAAVIRHGATRWSLGVLALALVLARGIASPVALHAQLGVYERITDAIERRWLPDGVVELPGESSARDLVVLTAPSTSVPRTFLPGLRVGGEGQRAWYLSNNTVDFDHEWVRTGSNTFELATGAPRGARPLFETLWIGCEADTPASVRTRILRIEVQDRGIRRIRVKVDRDLDDPSLQFLAFREGALRPVRVPRVGERARL